MIHRRTTAVIALVLAGLAAPADAKRCRSLCSAQIQACRDACTEGSRGQRRRCRAACIAPVMTACRQSTEPVCTPPTPDDPGGAAPGDPGDGHACGLMTTCEHLASIAPGWQPGSTGAIPPDFPAPPPGAQLCGTDIGGIVHYLYAGPMDDVVAYYRQQFAAAGISFTGPDAPPDSRIGCDEVYRFDRPGRRIPGMLYLSLFQGHLALGNFDLP
jgi:hypothetical protein